VPAPAVRGAPVPAEPNPDDEADEAIDRLALGFVEDILDAEPGGSDLANASAIASSSHPRP
jgi:hypothetical protein